MRGPRAFKRPHPFQRPYNRPTSLVSRPNSLTPPLSRPRQISCSANNVCECSRKGLASEESPTRCVLYSSVGCIHGLNEDSICPFLHTTLRLLTSCGNKYVRQCWRTIISVIGYESEVDRRFSWFIYATHDLSVLAIFAVFETVACEFYFQ